MNRHDDGRLYIEAPAVKCHCHAVIAGAGGNHAVLGLVLCQRQQPVERAPFFE